VAPTVALFREILRPFWRSRDVLTVWVRTPSRSAGRLSEAPDHPFSSCRAAVIPPAWRPYPGTRNLPDQPAPASGPTRAAAPSRSAQARQDHGPFGHSLAIWKPPGWTPGLAARSASTTEPGWWLAPVRQVRACEPRIPVPGFSVRTSSPRASDSPPESSVRHP